MLFHLSPSVLLYIWKCLPRAAPLRILVDFAHCSHDHSGECGKLDGGLCFKQRCEHRVCLYLLQEKSYFCVVCRVLDLRYRISSVDTDSVNDLCCCASGSAASTDDRVGGSSSIEYARRATRHRRCLFVQRHEWCGR